MTHIFDIFIVVIVVILVLISNLINNVIKLVFTILLVILIVAVILIIILKKKETKEVKKKKNGEKTEDVGTVIAIDLGTTYSRVGVYKNGRLKFKTLFPSYVAFTNEGNMLIGDAAKDQLIVNPKNTIFSFYSLMGRQWTDEVVQNSIREIKFSFDVVEQNGKVSIKIQTLKGEETFTPELICAMLIGEMKRIAERHEGLAISHAMVTVPANFNNAQRRAVKTAVNITGLEVLDLITAPIAAAIAYDLKERSLTGRDFKTGSDRKKNLLVFDLGGSHFDINVISIDNGNFTVLSINGDTHLGGEDFDQRVVDHFIKIINTKTGRDVRQHSEALQKLRIEVEKAKKALSDSNQVKIEIKALFENYDFVEILTHDIFEQLNEDLFCRIIETAIKTLADIKMNKTHINEIILAGGSSRIPKIQLLVKDYFDDRDLYLSNDDDILFGTAVQSSGFSGEEDTEIIDIGNVTPFSIGVQDAKGWIGEMISKNTAIPVERYTITGTSEDGQTSVFINVYEGEKGMITNNRFLGTFELTGITPAPVGQTEIMVTLKLNGNGILQVSAKEIGTGNEKKLDISYDHNRRSLEDIENMIEKFRRYY